ncbi:DNA recombination protein RmuC [Methylobrevis albus]|uniref:DNA recombination protein RmuC homolog n=1 Tax=Methylobrevis albus TaxID=2793297 RepID=A0A931I584_9HYPH|nr:DNA recombination protein RmuC [Methylobrevis albus]MBH0239508.1 DNA recombination protein RmuC [Methylobrevis albus]
MVLPFEVVAWSSVVAAVAAVLALLVALRALAVAGRPGGQAIAALAAAEARLERLTRDEFRASRDEASAGARELRVEVGGSIRGLADGVLTQMAELSRLQKDLFQGFSNQLRDGAVETERRQLQSQVAMLGALKDIRDHLLQQVEAMKGDNAGHARALAERTAASLAQFGETSAAQMAQLFAIQKAQHSDFAERLGTLGAANAAASEALRQAVEAQLSGLRRENAEKLDQMRVTVDEKLQGTLEQRLGESFKLVGDRLEAVHRGLGEVQTLAAGVGDLKRVLTNVKTRGGWGEVQLGALLEQLLTPAQYIANASVAETGGERVEFAVRLPGGDDGREVLLPIDAKFPVEDWERLQLAADAGDRDGVEAAAKALDQRLRQSARDIADKYVLPPRTTDFAILFLPTEGLFAEVIRRPGLTDELQRQFRVVVAGPTTLAALLSSLQMGFRTLAIQERSSEVWQILAGVKTEFGKFGPVLEKVKKKLQEASNTLDQADVRSRAIGRRLRDVETLPQPAAVLALEVDGFDEEEETAA